MFNLINVQNKDERVEQRQFHVFFTKAPSEISWKCLFRFLVKRLSFHFRSSWKKGEAGPFAELDKETRHGVASYRISITSLFSCTFFELARISVENLVALLRSQIQFSTCVRARETCVTLKEVVDWNGRERERGLIRFSSHFLNAIFLKRMRFSFDSLSVHLMKFRGRSNVGQLFSELWTRYFHFMM